MTHFLTASYAAAGVGIVVAAAVLAFVRANRRLEDPYELDRLGAFVVAGAAALAAGLFAALGSGALSARVGVPPLLSLLASLVAVPLAVGLATLALQPLVYRYVRWARTPSVLREEAEEGY